MILIMTIIENKLQYIEGIINMEQFVKAEIDKVKIEKQQQESAKEFFKSYNIPKK